MATKLANYLRTYRKRTGLTQEDVAFLLGCRTGTKVGRYETSARIPNLQTVLALEVVLKTAVKDLFAGVYEDAARAVADRARMLLRFAERATNARRNATLYSIAKASPEASGEDLVWEPLTGL